MEEAMNIATQQVPGEVVRVELDTEHGIPVYEVEIVTQQGVEYEVNVDVNTGDIVDIELD
ncbi:peptidase [Virgibacillus dakarensis]|nr:PepSY domain-containing protein [Virgibacillus dakarensis]MTW87134.1 peptidase [Virgibacillus dakarensis]